MLNFIQNVFIIKCICKRVDYCYWKSYFQPSKDGHETRSFMQPLFFSYQFELVVTEGCTREIKHLMAVLRNWWGGASDHKNIKPPWSQSINIFLTVIISYRERSSQLCTQYKQLLQESLKSIQSGLNGTLEFILTSAIRVRRSQVNWEVVYEFVI